MNEKKAAAVDKAIYLKQINNNSIEYHHSKLFDTKKPVLRMLLESYNNTEQSGYITQYC